jgi:hypothetical protein
MRLNINNVKYLVFNKTNGVNIAQSRFKGSLNVDYWLNNLIVYKR